MNYAVYWNYNFKHFDTVDEIIIKYTDQKIDVLTNFLNRYPNKKFSLEIENLTESFISMAAALKAKYNIVLRLAITNVKQQELLNKCKENNLPFYFNFYINNWDTLNDLIRTGVSEVIITGELGFDLERLTHFLEDKNIQVRCMPNFVQSSYRNEHYLTSFWLRPEDVAYIEYKGLHVDTLEFYDNDEYQDPRLNPNFPYEVYAIDKKWSSDLAGIIIGIPPKEVDSAYIMPAFIKHRVNCGKRCMKGSKCTLCYNYCDLSGLLKDYSLVPTQYVDILKN